MTKTIDYGLVVLPWQNWNWLKIPFYNKLKLKKYKNYNNEALCIGNDRQISLTKRIKLPNMNNGLQIYINQNRKYTV